MDIADCYSYRVQWSEEDGEYVGTVTEFPGLSWLDESPVDTFIGIQNVIKECVEDMRAHGENPPGPYADRKILRQVRRPNPPGGASVIRHGGGGTGREPEPARIPKTRRLRFHTKDGEAPAWPHISASLELTGRHRRRPSVRKERYHGSHVEGQAVSAAGA